jgi:hypothetical protein
MTLKAQWRTKGRFSDAVLVLDDGGRVRDAFPASQPVLSRLLTNMGDLATWRGDSFESDRAAPEEWGELVIERASSGEVIEVEPELFWQGIYLWFRSRGVDYDSAEFRNSAGREAPPILKRSSPMDD